MFRTMLFSLLLPKQNLSRCYSAQKTISDRYKEMFYPAFPTPPYNFICQIGDPVLRQKCDRVEESLISTPRFQSLINHMWEVHSKYECIGLSAPQIGLPLQLAVIGLTEAQCKQEKSELFSPVSPRVLINPVMKVLDYKSKTVSPEACGSMCGFSAQVSRFTDIRVEALNEKGEKVAWRSQGFEARVIQHEIQHLDGTIYVDVMEPKTLECTVWQRVNLNKGKGSIYFGPQKKSTFGSLW